jgi:hypothetical protein
MLVNPSLPLCILLGDRGKTRYVNQGAPVDALAVYEFRDRLASHQLTPEQSLILAILEDALRLAGGDSVDFFKRVAGTVAKLRFYRSSPTS